MGGHDYYPQDYRHDNFDKKDKLCHSYCDNTEGGGGDGNGVFQ